MCFLWGTNWVLIFQKTTFFIVTAVKTSNLNIALGNMGGFLLKEGNESTDGRIRRNLLRNLVRKLIQAKSLTKWMRSIMKANKNCSVRMLRFRPVLVTDALICNFSRVRNTMKTTLSGPFRSQPPQLKLLVLPDHGKPEEGNTTNWIYHKPRQQMGFRPHLLHLVTSSCNYFTRRNAAGG
jgi:hypothetical protein